MTAAGRAGIEIRDTRPDDLAAIERLYADAFPDEELRPLVRTLLQETPGVLSLAATAETDAETEAAAGAGPALVGHVAVTPCAVRGAAARAALLGPLAVAPARQRSGIGRALVDAGLDRLRGAGVARVFVLGDPGYYRRFGFAPERAVTPPYPLPGAWGDGWQSLALAPAPLHGALEVPPAWAEPAYWAP
jgi:putative acetyltransferase